MHHKRLQCVTLQPFRKDVEQEIENRECIFAGESRLCCSRLCRLAQHLPLRLCLPVRRPCSVIDNVGSCCIITSVPQIL